MGGLLKSCLSRKRIAKFSYSQQKTQKTCFSFKKFRLFLLSKTTMPSIHPPHARTCNIHTYIHTALFLSVN